MGTPDNVGTRQPAAQGQGSRPEGGGDRGGRLVVRQVGVGYRRQVIGPPQPPPSRAGGSCSQRPYGPPLLQGDRHASETPIGLSESVVGFVGIRTWGHRRGRETPQRSRAWRSRPAAGGRRSPKGPEAVRRPFPAVFGGFRESYGSQDRPGSTISTSGGVRVARKSAVEPVMPSGRSCLPALGPARQLHPPLVESRHLPGFRTDPAGHDMHVGAPAVAMRHDQRLPVLHPQRLQALVDGPAHLGPAGPLVLPDGECDGPWADADSIGAPVTATAKARIGI